MHGGLTIEFIGVKPLKSCVPLVIWDLVVMILQLILFSINFPINEPPRYSRRNNGMDVSYSGQMVVREIPIIQSVFHNWHTPLPTANSNNRSPNETSSAESERPSPSVSNLV